MNSLSWALLCVSSFLVAVAHNPQYYKTIYLNDFCSGGGISSSTELYNTSSAKSAAIVRATQRRTKLTDRQLCEYQVSSAAGTGLIVTVEKLDLRKGFFNDSCIDYIRAKTKYQFLTENKPMCGVISERDTKYWTSTYNVEIEMYTKSPVSYFVEGDVVRIIITSYTDAQDGKCGGSQFKCDNSHCIFLGYRCDQRNNCGDNSDETWFGTSACVMPRTSLVLIILGVTNFIVTWCAVIYCCVRSAMSKSKSEQEERWATTTFGVTTTTIGGRGSSITDVTGEGAASPDVASGPLPTGTARFRKVSENNSVRDPTSAITKE